MLFDQSVIVRFQREGTLGGERLEVLHLLLERGEVLLGVLHAAFDGEHVGGGLFADEAEVAHLLLRVVELVEHLLALFDALFLEVRDFVFDHVEHGRRLRLLLQDELQLENALVEPVDQLFHLRYLAAVVGRLVRVGRQQVEDEPAHARLEVEPVQLHRLF